MRDIVPQRSTSDLLYQSAMLDRNVRWMGVIVLVAMVTVGVMVLASHHVCRRRTAREFETE